MVYRNIEKNKKYILIFEEYDEVFKFKYLTTELDIKSESEIESYLSFNKKDSDYKIIYETMK